MSASRTAELGVVMVCFSLVGALLWGAVERKRDAADRAT
jgi:hypothetical protein